jgi:hypothetical protein
MNRFGQKPCLLGVLVLGAGSFASAAAPADRDRIDRRIGEIQPTRKEKRFDDIGWVKGLREAERLSRKSARPVFLFSNVGDLDLGRC